MANAQTYAHYFEGRGRKELILTSGPELRGYPGIADTNVQRIVCVNGKRQARQIAAQHDAQPWNF